MNTRSPESDSYYERDISQQKDDCRKALGKLPAFIEEAFANASDASTGKLIAHYLCGADLRPALTEMINQWAQRCIDRALNPNNGGPPNVGGALQKLEDDYS